MAIKLALRNVKSRPLRTAATILVVAIAVALLFCMFSFETVVYEYIYAIKTADIGDSDVIINTSSSGGRIMNAKNLESVEGVDKVVPTLSMYTVYKDNYVRVRGFDKGDAEGLQKINVVDGDLSAFDENSDNVVVSRAFAEENVLSVGQAIDFENGTNSKTFYVCAIAENDGYFLNANPHVVIARAEGVVRLVYGEFVVYNEIYIKTATPDEVIRTLKGMEEYQGFIVDYAKDMQYIETQSSSMSAPVVVAGLGVVLLAVACVGFISLTTVADRRKYIAKLTVVGGTKRQIFTIFLVEVLFVAFVGAVVGSVLAGGLFALLAKLVLSSLISFSVSALKLFASAAIGFALAVLGVALPVSYAFRSSVRENEFAIGKGGLARIIIPVILTIITAVLVIVEHTVPGVKGGISIVNLALLLITLIVDIPFIYRGLAKLLSFSKRAIPSLIGKFESRNLRHFGLQIMTAGMAVVMLLFMAWSLTTDIFTGYLSEFENKIFVTNVPASVADENNEYTAGMRGIDGVRNAVPLVWKQIGVELPSGKDRQVNLIGTANAFDLVDVDFITDESTVRKAVTDDGYVVIDKAYAELYGYEVGDTMTFEIDGKTADLTVGGIVHHILFSGNYVIISLDTLKSHFGVEADTVIVVSENTAVVADEIRKDYSKNNFYVVEALTMYEWDADSMSAVFDLVGALAVILTVLTYLVLVASAIVSFPNDEKARASLLSAGMSKNGLLGMETGKSAFTAVVSYLLSFAMSVAMTVSLINALRIFDLYFEFMYDAGMVALTGGVLAAAYVLIPIILGYKRKYNMLRK